MKISVQFEADSAEELLAAFQAFHLKPPLRMDVRETMDKAAERTTKAWDTEPAVQPTTEAKLAEALQVQFDERQEAAPVEPPPVVKTRKPRGPNRPKPEAVAAPPPEPQAEPPRYEPPKPEPSTPIEVVSRQDMLDVFAEYVQCYGANFGYVDVSSLLQKHLGDGIRKASDVPDGMLATAVGAIKAAIADNPYNRKRDYA